MLGFKILWHSYMYSCRSRSHAYDKKEQIDLRNNQSVQNQKEFIHQLFGLTT